MKPFSYYDLLDAFILSGCPLCRLLREDADRYLDLLLREGTTDPGIVGGFRASRGLCNVHAWKLVNIRGQASGVGALHEAALDEVVRLLDNLAGQGPVRRLLNRDAGGASVAETLTPLQPCQCCALMDSAERQYLKTIADHFSDEQMQEAYRVSDGLCLPHFRLFIPLMRDPALIRIAVEAEARILRSLKDEVDMFLRKAAAPHALELIGAEGDSWKRAVRQLVGDQEVFGMRRHGSR